MKTAEFYRQQADEMLERAALADRIASVLDNFENGTAVRFTKLGHQRLGDEGALNLTYVAVRVTLKLGAVRWFLTGNTTAQGGYSWSSLLDFVGHDNLDTLELLDRKAFLFGPAAAATTLADETNVPA